MVKGMGFKAACVSGLIAGLALGGCIVVVDRDDNWSDSWSDSKPSPRIGVGIAEPGKTLANQLRIDRNDATVITRVSSGSAADKAGLREFDIVTRIDGDDNADPDDLRKAVRSKQWGDTLILTIIREGQTIEVPVTLTPRDARQDDYPS